MYATELEELNATSTVAVRPNDAVLRLSNEEIARQTSFPSSSNAASAPRRWAAPPAARIQHDLDGEPWDLETAAPSGPRAEDDTVCAVDLRALTLDDASDDGLCLSMVCRRVAHFASAAGGVHDRGGGGGGGRRRVRLPWVQWQPWASLLVYGIKRVEGRPWYTSHRGRLWIASAALKPQSSEAQQVIDDHLAHHRSCWRGQPPARARARKTHG